MTLLFIFDMDDVLYDYDWKVRMAGMTAITGLSLDELRERWWHADGEWKAEAGGFAGPDEYLAAFNEAIGVQVSEEDWIRVRGAAMTPWPESIAAVKRASEFGRVTLLTNNGPLSHKHLATLAPDLVDVFGDHLFASSYYGARKPNPIVFERVLKAYETPASDAFFADDLKVNVEGARSVGITAHRFTSAPKLLAAIEQFATSHSA